MQIKHFSLLTLAGYALAQSGESPQSLNATLSGNNDLSNLTSFLSLNPSLVRQLSNASNITILAPNNNAFSMLANTSAGMSLASDPGLITALLTYHVLNGTYTASQITNMSAFIPTMLMNSSYANVTGGQRVEAVKVGNETAFFSGLLQNATVSQADVNFTGGVIHVIDRVLTIPETVLDTAAATNLTSLYGAINATNLTDVVNYTPNLTIFAPDNEAFRSISSAFANLSDTDLANILAYHVVNNTLGYSDTLMNGTTLTASNGEDIRITIENGTVFANAARVIKPNVLVANGVVHVIDNVLNPSNTTGPSPSATSGAAGFSGSAGSEVPFTSGQPTPSTTVNPSSAGPGAATSSSSSGVAAMPMKTAVVGYGALLGAGAAVFFV